MLILAAVDAGGWFRQFSIGGDLKGRHMTKRSLFPAGSETSADQIKVSPGVVSGGHVFLTGVTGYGPDA